MRLSDYIPTGGRTAFALKVGCSPSTLDRICQGKQVPRPALMVKIIKATGGVVSSDDLMFPARELRAEAYVA